VVNINPAHVHGTEASAQYGLSSTAMPDVHVDATPVRAATSALNLLGRYFIRRSLAARRTWSASALTYDYTSRPLHPRQRPYSRRHRRPADQWRVPRRLGTATPSGNSGDQRPELDAGRVHRVSASRSEAPDAWKILEDAERTTSRAQLPHNPVRPHPGLTPGAIPTSARSALLRDVLRAAELAAERGSDAAQSATTFSRRGHAHHDVREQLYNPWGVDCLSPAVAWWNSATDLRPGAGDVPGASPDWDGTFRRN